MNSLLHLVSLFKNVLQDQLFPVMHEALGPLSERQEQFVRALALLGLDRFVAELVAAYPPQRNQHGVSHWPVMQVVVAHDVVSALAVRPCWGPHNGPKATSEQALAKEMM